MSILALRQAGGYLHFDEEECRSEGQARSAQYQSASPFPHIVMDDFLDAALLRTVAESFPSIEGKRFFDRDQERFKFQFGAGQIKSGLARNLLAELNSHAFLVFLEEMTGIEGLIPDPYLLGGGLHLTRPGGHLGVHADFNIHEKLKIERRLNLLVYLNDDWSDDFGGCLELWDTSMTRCDVKVAPILGRAVVFNTCLDSYHGHPEPLACPPDRDRRSIATYYYSAFEDGMASVPSRTTQFRPRPGTNDRYDWRVKWDHLVSDWVPLKLQGIARRLNPFRR